MKVSSVFPLLSTFIVMLSCRNDSVVDIVDCSDGCILLSGLEDKTDYLMPFSLYNDFSSTMDAIYLNDEKIDLPFGQGLDFLRTGFFELKIDYANHDRSDEVKFFTLVTEERESSEWGIETWIPARYATRDLEGESVEVICPRKYIAGIGIPFLFYITELGQRSSVYTQGLYIHGMIPFNIKQGVGSVVLTDADISGVPVFDVGGKEVEVDITETDQSATQLSGDLSGDVVIPANSLVHVTGDLHIPSGASMTVEAGSIIIIDEAVNISNEGPITFNGDLNNPVLVTCSASNKYWGGFISKTGSAQITAGYTFFCRSGYHDTGDYTSWGHAKRQALFYTENTKLTLDHCYMLDQIGQVFFPKNVQLSLESILVQRAKTSGQLNYTTAIIENSIFTDFPDDSQVFRDEDNDALYINASDVTINACLFMFAKDDGVDSGGNLGGTITVTDTRFEACFHEGAALSSMDEVEKNHSFTNCIFYNCGQGLEMGFSSPNHTVTAENCQFLKNYIGIRFGDNYTWSDVNGQMIIKNCYSLYNGKDVWNMVRKSWAPKLDHMHFENTKVSGFVPQYPELEIISQ
jgi:hypothetical protein